MAKTSTERVKRFNERKRQKKEADLEAIIGDGVDVRLSLTAWGTLRIDWKLEGVAADAVRAQAAKLGITPERYLDRLNERALAKYRMQPKS